MYLKENELLKILNISHSALYTLRKKGLPIIKIGGSVRYDLDSVKKWINEQQVKEG